MNDSKVVALIGDNKVSVKAFYVIEFHDLEEILVGIYDFDNTEHEGKYAGLSKFSLLDEIGETNNTYWTIICSKNVISEGDETIINTWIKTGKPQEDFPGFVTLLHDAVKHDILPEGNWLIHVEY